MREKEKLEWIFDTMGYKSKYNYDYSSDDVREIIFTQDFWDKLVEYVNTELPTMWNVYWRDRLLEHLDDPVSYLYNLLHWDDNQ